MADPEFVGAVAPVAAVLEGLGVAYYIAGSVVSSRYGIARSTVDVDLVADLRLPHAAALEQALRDDYYVDLDAVTDAIRRRAMFNVVHLATMLKVDVYATSTPFDRSALSRSAPGTFSDAADARVLTLATAEDVVVHKLSWFRMGGHVSDRQWSDIVGVLRVQSGRLDLSHMRRWATDLDVLDLLEQALSEAAS